MRSPVIGVVHEFHQPSSSLDFPNLNFSQVDLPIHCEIPKYITRLRSVIQAPQMGIYSAAQQLLLMSLQGSQTPVPKASSINNAIDATLFVFLRSVYVLSTTQLYQSASLLQSPFLSHP